MCVCVYSESASLLRFICFQVSRRALARFCWQTFIEQPLFVYVFFKYDKSSLWREGAREREQELAALLLNIIEYYARVLQNLRKRPATDENKYIYSYEYALCLCGPKSLSKKSWLRTVLDFIVSVVNHKYKKIFCNYLQLFFEITKLIEV